MINGPIMYGAAGVLALLLGLNAYQWVNNARLELNLSRCETKTAQLVSDQVISRLEVDGLKDVILEQNNAIARLRADSSERERLAANAQDRAAARKAADMQAIADLASQQGVSCSEGIALLDWELGL